MIDEKSRIRRAEGLVANKMDQETVMMSVEKGKYYALNPVAGRIWEIIEPPCTVAEVIDQLLEEYTVDRNTCQIQVLELLDKLQREGLVKTD